MQTKKLMILGAGVYQVPLIKKALEMEIDVIVVSPHGNYPGIKLTDHHVALDTTDSVGILKCAKENKIDGIVTTGTDVAVPTIGMLVDEMGLKGTGYKASNISMDKTLMKHHLAVNQIPSAKYRTIDVKNDLDLQSEADQIGYPLMVKASDSSGSRGVIKVDEPEKLKDAFVEASSYSRNGLIILEEFLAGIEIGAQAVVIEGELVQLFIHNDTLSPPPTNAPIGHSMPVDIDKELLQKIEKVVVDTVKSIGINDTIANVDLMLVENEPYIIEIGARMGATCLPENISLYWGIDAYEFLIKLSLGIELPSRHSHAGQANASLLLTSKKSGTVASISVPASFQNECAIRNIEIDVTQGEHVNAFKVGPDRIGSIVVTADTAREAEKLAHFYASQISIEVSE